MLHHSYPLIHLGEEKQGGTKFHVKNMMAGHEPEESFPGQTLLFYPPSE